jgi:hypothetical protein
VQNFGGAACQSASFHWPLTVTGDSVFGNFHFWNSTLKGHLENRLPQKILIDAGDLERHPVFQANLRNLVFNEIEIK